MGATNCRSAVRILPNYVGAAYENTLVFLYAVIPMLLDFINATEA
jgi:hypothetical protein